MERILAGLTDAEVLERADRASTVILEAPEPLAEAVEEMLFRQLRQAA